MNSTRLNYQCWKYIFYIMKSEALLKEEAHLNQIPKRLQSRDKKTNSLIEREFYRSKIKKQRTKINALMHNFQPGYMEAEQGQQTLKVTQKEIKELVNVQTAQNIFELNLNMGAYHCEYSHNGATLLLHSSMGHTCLVNWRDKVPLLELNLRENITHAKFLHNDEMFGMVQSTGTYVYDNRGIQLHKLERSLGMEYLPYHFLLATYDQRKLRYYDTTTGHVIADHVAKNPYTVMRQNPSNAIIALGSSKGTVEWWTPGIGTPAIKMFVGAGISDIGFHKGYMYTAAESLKVWDSRMLKVLHTYPLERKLNSLEVSQSGLVALNYGFRMEMFKDAHEQRQTHPYMTYKATRGNINNCRFVPFEDLLGMGSNQGFNSIAVPGSGVPYYDSFENNPFESKKQKRQALVHKLLDKLPPETITVDPNVLGNIDKTKREILNEEQKEENQKNEKQAMQKRLKKKKMRGKGSIKNRLNRKTIELQKIKRAQLTKVINTKLWAKWAQKKKKQSQMQILEEISQKGLSVADIVKASNKKTKQIQKETN